MIAAVACTGGGGDGTPLTDGLDAASFDAATPDGRVNNVGYDAAIQPRPDAGGGPTDAGSTKDADADAATCVIPPDVDAGPSVDGSVSDGGTTCTSDPKCASDAGGCFVLVPGSNELGTTDFCISKFEMKAAGSSVASVAPGSPVSNVDRAQAKASCEALAAGVTLPSNAQWQTLARNIELVDANWSGGVVGTGAINRGHSDVTPNMPLGVANLADPCDQTGNPGCTDGASPAFSQKRTHVLSTGSVIWDVAGNVNEWVADDLSPSGYFSDYAGRVASADRAAFGPLGTYAIGPRPDPSSNYPSNAIVEPGALAVVEGKNFEKGTIWVRAGGVVLVRGSNFSGSIELEPNAGFINSGSNIIGSGPRIASAKSNIDGTFTPTSMQNLDVRSCDSSCNGACPVGTQTFATDGSRGFGYALLYDGKTFPNYPFGRGGHFGYGPMAGLFTAIPYPTAAFTGFRCVKAPN